MFTAQCAHFTIVNYCKDNPYIQSTSNHPPHIKNSPSAFIPFCEYSGNMMAMGEMIEHFSLPVCNKFTPKILDGQLCYQVDVNSIEVVNKKAGAKLTFLLDYNEDRHHDILSGNMFSPKNTPKSLDDMKGNKVINNEAMIYIDTIGITF